MKTWKKILIIANLMLGIGAIGCAGVLGYAYYKSNVQPKHYSWWTDDLSDRITVHRFSDYTRRVYDKQRKRYLSKSLNWVSTGVTPDSLVVFCTMDEKRGYLHAGTGEVVIAPQFQHAWNFSEGKAAVYQNGQLYFINKQGQKIFDAVFTPGSHSITRLGFAFHDNLCVMCDSANNCGIIDTLGNWVIEPIYDCIWNTDKFGHRTYQNNGKWGLLTHRGDIFMEAVYDDEVVTDSEGRMKLIKDGIMWQIDQSGRVVEPFLCTGMQDVYYETEEVESMLSPYKIYSINYNDGIVDAKGRVVIPAIYYQVKQVNENFFRAQLSNSGEWLLLDKQGRKVESY